MIQIIKKYLAILAFFFYKYTIIVIYQTDIFGKQVKILRRNATVSNCKSDYENICYKSFVFGLKTSFTLLNALGHQCVFCFMEENMKKIIRIIVAMMLLAFLFLSCGNNKEKNKKIGELETTGVQSDVEMAQTGHYPVTIKNVNFSKEEVEFTYEKAPERVLTFWSNSLETLLKLGLGDRVICAVGMNEDSVLDELKPELAKMKKNASYYNDFKDSNAAMSKETAVMLDPDFILAWKSSFSDKTIGDVGYWNDKGVGTYIALNSNDVREQKSLENEYTDILNIGKIFDVEDRANQLVSEMKAEVQSITERTKGQKKRTCLVIENMRDSIWNYGKNTLAGDMVIKMGGELPDVPRNIGKEDVINVNPEVLFVIGSDKDGTGEKLKKVTEDPAYANLTAVKNNDCYLVPLSYVYTSGVRTKYGLNLIGKALYPDLYGDE